MRFEELWWINGSEGGNPAGSWGGASESTTSSWGCNGEREPGRLGVPLSMLQWQWSSLRISGKNGYENEGCACTCIQETWLFLWGRGKVRKGRFGKEKATFKKNHGPSCVQIVKEPFVYVCFWLAALFRQIIFSFNVYKELPRRQGNCLCSHQYIGKAFVGMALCRVFCSWYFYEKIH